MFSPNFKSRFYKIVRSLAFIFIVMFVFRLIYGYVNTNDRNNSDMLTFQDQSISMRKNYASEKFIKGIDISTQMQIASNQKYEKTATIQSKTSEFEKDEKKIRALTKSKKAIIQYEQNSGNKGNRSLQLSIGVIPAEFDSFYMEAKKIGTLKWNEITKVDKTNEYRELNARKISLEKSLNSLNELKSRTGQIDDLISLNEKILDTEEKLQGLGVELGNYDTENEFCTVKFSLKEGFTEKSISFSHRIKVALEWTIKYYAILMTGLSFLALAAFLFILIIEKLKILKILEDDKGV